MKKAVYFEYPDLHFGGAQTLMVRMAKWFLEHEYATYLCCTNCEAGFKRYLDTEGIPVLIMGKNLLRSLLRKAARDDLVFCFSLQDYLRAKLRYGSKRSVVLYVIHTGMMDLRRLNKIRILQSFMRTVLKPVIVRGLEKHSIILMDPACAERIQTYYRLQWPIRKQCIFPLPYESGPLSQEQIPENAAARFQGRRILAIARADFPFKGYLLGLIRRFPEICKAVDECFLDIISHGPGEARITEAIEELDPLYRERVVFHGGKSYDALLPFYLNAQVYIGMGSTLVEAGRCGLPAIDVKPNTEELALNGATFADEPMFLGTTDESYAYTKDLNLLYSILKMDREDYCDLCLRTFEQFQNHYEIGTIMERMIEYFELSAGHRSQ